MSPLTQTLPLAQRLRTWSTPSFPLSSATQAPPTPHPPPRPLPPSPNYNRLYQTQPGPQNHYMSNPTTNQRHNPRIHSQNRHNYPYPNQPLLQPPSHPPRLPLSPTLPRSFHVLPRTLPPIFHITHPILKPSLCPPPYPHAIPATPASQPQWASFACPRERLAPIPSSLPHFPRPPRPPQPTRAV